MPEEIVYSPADFVTVFNQTLELAYPRAVIEGELSSFRVSRGKWVYFDLQDEMASIKCFGTVFQLPGPLEDGMSVRVAAVPRLHERFGFSLNIQSITPVGEGALKKASQLLAAKLQKEGLFDLARKRSLTLFPERVGLITADNSAAQADFIEILNQRWGGVEVVFADALMQGEAAPAAIVQALETLNRLSTLPEVVVITRGGGSDEDLSAFNDERVVRAIAASRIPTLVAIGHETDESLAELVADVRASTPSNAAQTVVPDKMAQLQRLKGQKSLLSQTLSAFYNQSLAELDSIAQQLSQQLLHQFSAEQERLSSVKRLATGLDPKTVLRRGYALVRQNNSLIRSVKAVKKNDELSLELADGRINTVVKGVTQNG